MKVAFITRSTLFTVRGGDTFQVTETAKHLGEFGIEVDIFLTGQYIDYSMYDLLHFFNIIRPADILYHINKSNKPFVLSTILIDYSEADKFYRRGIYGFLSRHLYSNQIEYLKTIARFIKRKDKIRSVSYLWHGQKRSIKKILNNALMLFPNSKTEYDALVKYYNCSTAYTVIPNGINCKLFCFDASIKKDPSLVICAARIEGIKNQLNLIKAINNTSYKLLIIGAPAPNQLSYYKECKKIAASNITFIEQLEQHALLSYYNKASVHVLPSWFETCGLSSLEAAAMGCNIVITNKGYTSEYYESYAFYCDPSSTESIFKAVENAAKAGFPDRLREKILSQYTWQHAADGIASSYYNLIS
ncbi:MAG: glycosyltransferase family 4 protein [Bacteroidetes bacterium]|nr:glycosyltransferase family 4 protein [Bacteroidota bacterium]